MRSEIKTAERHLVSREQARDRMAAKIYQRAENMGRFHKLPPDEVAEAVELAASQVRAAIRLGTWAMTPSRGSWSNPSQRHDG